MRKILVVLLCAVMLVGCDHNDTPTVAESTEHGFSLPYEISTDEGTIELSNIYIWQDRTEHGYDGWIAFEFDYSGLSGDEQYWFDKENSIQIINSSLSEVEISYFYEMESEIVDGKKYVFEMIEENQNRFGEQTLAVEISVGDIKTEIRDKCLSFEIVDELPEDINKIYLETGEKSFNGFTTIGN